MKKHKEPKKVKQSVNEPKKKQVRSLSNYNRFQKCLSAYRKELPKEDQFAYKETLKKLWAKHKGEPIDALCQNIDLLIVGLQPKNERKYSPEDFFKSYLNSTNWWMFRDDVVEKIVSHKKLHKGDIITFDGIGLTNNLSAVVTEDFDNIEKFGDKAYLCLNRLFRGFKRPHYPTIELIEIDTETNHSTGNWIIKYGINVDEATYNHAIALGRVGFISDDELEKATSVNEIEKESQKKRVSRKKETRSRSCKSNSRISRSCKSKD
ncbi:MAG: hypothetical protein HC892_10010 [Saprospiraceae bacterium]|nr:hypothetical protein [Saprospiraceae bacterium]